ncbi:MAG TPA: ATP-binding protein [Roseiflexaceae bacterium]|nr:ATP-binding protein [Roseiflexaceae bacterium]
MTQTSANRPRRPLSLTAQIRYGLPAFSLLALLLTGGLLIELSFRAELQRVVAVERAQSRAAAVEIDAGLDDIRRTLGYLARVHGLIDQPPAVRRSLLEAIERHNSAFGAVALLDARGSVVAQVVSFGAPFEVDMSAAPVFSRAFLWQEEYIGPVEIDPHSDLPTVVLGVPSRDGQGRVSGALAARVSLAFLEEVVARTQVGQSGYAYVVDDRGELIADRSGTLGEGAVINLAERPYVRRIGATTPALAAYTGLYGDEVLGAAAPVVGTPWHVVVELPTAEAYAPVRHMLEIMGAALLATALLATVLGALFARRIVRPLASLTAAAQRMSTGDLEARVDVRAHNELGTLAAAFNTMAARLARLFVEQAARAEAEAAQRRFAFLSEASATLGASLDYEITLANLARLVVPALADWCTIDTLDEHGHLRRVGAAHRDPQRTAELWALARHYPIDPQGQHPVARAIRSGEPVVISEARQEQLASISQDEGHIELLSALAPRSVLVAPLRARGRVLGAISLASEEPGHYRAGTLAMAEDLAQRAAIAVDNTLLYREAQHAIRARDEFLSMASHELKTPLTALMGNAQLLQRRIARGKPIGDREQRSLVVIVEQVLRLNRLIDTLLDMGRIDRGQIAIQRAPLDLGALVRRVAAEFKPTLERHILSCHISGEPLVVSGDELRLVQVLQNLLQNAIKYSPAGGPVELRLERRADQARITVADQGIGIPPEALPRLFDRFYRAGNTRQQQLAGLGIGLYVVKEIVTLHGGTVEVASREGEGTAFIVTLPLLVEPQPIVLNQESTQTQGRAD